MTNKGTSTDKIYSISRRGQSIGKENVEPAGSYLSSTYHWLTRTGATGTLLESGTSRR